MKKIHIASTTWNELICVGPNKKQVKKAALQILKERYGETWCREHLYEGVIDIEEIFFID